MAPYEYYITETSDWMTGTITSSTLTYTTPPDGVWYSPPGDGFYGFTIPTEKKSVVPEWDE